MKVAFDVGPTLRQLTGVGRYALELARHLQEQAVELRPYAVALRGRGNEGIWRWRLPARIVHRVWQTMEKPAPASLLRDVDLVHGTNFVLPPLDGRPGVVTVHDLSFLDDDALPVAHLRRSVPWTLERATLVLVPTAAVGHELTERFDVSPDRWRVTHEGVSHLFSNATPLAEEALARRGINRPFALAVGQLQPRKNLHRLIAAWDAVRADRPDWTLVIAGPKGWGPALPETPRVVLTGYLGDETLPGVVAAAEIFCYPSLYEGFGLPPLEAMAAGTPALVGDYLAAREVLGDDALRVDPLDVDAIARGLYSLASDDSLRARLRRSGRAHASSYTWDRTARATRSAYAEALGA